MFDLHPHLLDRKEQLNLHNGIPKTPSGVAYRMVDMSRQSGRTRVLIEGLPEDGRAIIMVWRLGEADYLKTEIGNVRGKDYPIKNLKFLSYESWKRDRGARLRGLGPLPVFIDNNVHDMLSIEVTEWINSFFNRGTDETD